jgi:hypothetical protein
MSLGSNNARFTSALTVEDIAAKILTLDEGLVFDKNWGERALFYNPRRALKKGIYVATFKERDGPNDGASKLDRGGIFRLNLGLSKASYFALFGFPPTRPAAGKTVDTEHDFSALDTLTPHPVYGWMSWVAIINPSRDILDELMPLIVETVEAARIKFDKKCRVYGPAKIQA